MQIIDVTLRDGGHVKDFDWPLDYAKDHYKNICKIPEVKFIELGYCCLLYTSPSPRDRTRSRMPSSA